MDYIPEKVISEARAQITWGKSPKDVVALLQLRGIDEESAREFIEKLMKDRAADIRAAGFRKVVTGSLLIPPCIGYYFLSMWAGYWFIWIFAGLGTLALFGIIKVFDGLQMILRPRSVPGDLVDTD